MRKKKSIKRTLIGLSVIPAIFIGIAITYISQRTQWESMTNEISNSLALVSRSVYNTYSFVAQGDYVLEDGVLMKGEQVIEGDYSIVDALKSSYGMEITVFYGNERYLTTIKDAEGKRIVGTAADEQAVHWVLEEGREYFSEKVEINGEDYFGYYTPILNQDKSVVGMSFAGKKRAEVMNYIQSGMVQSVLISAVIVIITLLVSVVSSQKIIEALRTIMEYLGHLANSDFSQKMPQNVLKRKDEIGDMGHYAEVVNRSLKEMITTDPLTGLYNRRACKLYLDKWIEKSNKQNKDLVAVGIGDIDFFKKINDTYGHDCGDLVLVTVSQIFKKYMKDNGCASRWGGEEFLFVFEEDLESVKKRLETMLREIRDYEFVYKEHKFRITLSFGLNAMIVGKTFDEIINEADECMYRGKEGGRDRILVTDGTEILF